MARCNLTPLERFWGHVDKGPSNECWKWKASTSNGYGNFFMHGKAMAASRASWIFANGEISDGLCVLHSCDVRSCINPAHLFLGTYQDNSDDMWKKGRGPDTAGEANGRAELSTSEVLEVRRRYDDARKGEAWDPAAGRFKPRERVIRGTLGILAAEFSVSRGTIKSIGMRTTWAHLPEAC